METLGRKGLIRLVMVHQSFRAKKKDSKKDNKKNKIKQFSLIYLCSALFLSITV